MRQPILVSCLAIVLAAGCSRESATPATPTAMPETAALPARNLDENSYAEPQRVKITDLALDLTVDFDRKELAGSATYTLDWLDKSARQLVLDTRDLNIDKIEGAGAQWQPLQFALAPRDDKYGSKLTIQTPQQDQRVRVTYRTSPQASGLQWLEPGMTEGKQLPFMFSQSQAIHARSWVPLQDTPSVRFTYSAHVKSRPDVMVAMSADNDPQGARDGDYSFKMPQKIPSYLLAIAAGDLVFEPISGRSGVWAEPAMAKRAAAEFADTEKMIETAEKLYGPYRWGRYDILVLPPSFPFGGMENPRLTFATPTVVVGDKSLVSLVAHELAHSWSGNLVTNASWKDIWLNEGFTSYVENRIVEAVYGTEFADMERAISQFGLEQEIKGLPPEQQALALPPLTGRDPDEALTDVAYIKGAWFLSWLESRFGREGFDAFLKSYFDHFAFQSVSTDQFVDYLKANLVAKVPNRVTDAELDAWLNQPGIPSFAEKAQSRRFSIVDSARVAWLGSGQLPAAAITGEWSTQEWVRFLEAMPQTLRADQLQQLDKAYHFTGTPNGEIAQRWYPLTVRSGYAEARPAIADFLRRIGRRKLILPTYEALATTADGLAFAQEVLAKARPGYHPITTASVEALLSKARPVATTAPATAAATAGADQAAPPAQ
jgi:leukotriene-A4 hydrolase